MSILKSSCKVLQSTSSQNQCPRCWLKIIPRSLSFFSLDTGFGPFCRTWLQCCRSSWLHLCWEAQDYSTWTSVQPQGKYFTLILIRALQKVIFTRTPGSGVLHRGKTGIQILNQGHRRKSKAKLGLGFLHCYLQTCWNVFDRLSAALVHAQHLPSTTCNGNCRQGWAAEKFWAVRLRCSFGRSMGLWWHMAHIMIYDTIGYVLWNVP